MKLVHFDPFDRENLCRKNFKNITSIVFSPQLDVERFKIEHIWQTIIDEEIKKSPMVTWLKTLANHTYAQAGMNRPMDSNYKGAKGQFPPIQKDDKNDIKNNDENDVTLTTTTSNQPEVDQT